MRYISRYGHKHTVFFLILMLVFLNFDIFELFFVLLFVFSIFFFRKRTSLKIGDNSQVLVPIDGKIIEISKGDFEGNSYTKVVIEKSLFGVGILYAPLGAKSAVLRRRHGLFLCTKMKISNYLNERAVYVGKDDSIKFAMRVIAGEFSRALKLENLSSFSKGDELGFIASGKVVLFLPDKTKIVVSVGDKVYSFATLGYLQKENNA